MFWYGRCRSDESSLPRLRTAARRTAARRTAAPPHAAPEFIGIDRAAAPASMAELDAYYEQIRPRLSAGEEAEHALRGIGR